ncbi:metallophosphoesterase [Intestinibacter sp.]|uniref:metallophosphoesterase n=1 Tax=Intestinibacter sp. TaxID=1965304 RepID=UPI003F1864FF
MGKLIVIGDIHGKTIWKDIVNQEFDKVIFLGDYVATHDDISVERQLRNLDDILEYKEKNLDKVVLLRGNHDLDSLGYSWARCSGHDEDLIVYMSREEYRNRFLNLTSWIHIHDNIVFSHAGISEVWLKEVANLDDITKINDLEPSPIFGFWANQVYDIYGDSPTQPPTWVRPITLARYTIEGYTQVVGHTQVKRIVNAKEAVKNKQDIWLCDALSINQYLIIDNGNFIIKTIQNESKN